MLITFQMKTQKEAFKLIFKFKDLIHLKDKSMEVIKKKATF